MVLFLFCMFFTWTLITSELQDSDSCGENVCKNSKQTDADEKHSPNYSSLVELLWEMVNFLQFIKAISLLSARHGHWAASHQQLLAQIDQDGTDRSMLLGWGNK